MGKNYFVSIFVDGKNVGSHYSDNLTELVTVRAIHGNCQIEILDLKNFVHLSKRDVAEKLNESVRKWRATIAHQESKANEVVEVKSPFKKDRNEKLWKRSVMCVETGQVFCSIREASEQLGIPYMTISNCIKNGNATRGVHFINVKKENKD